METFRESAGSVNRAEKKKSLKSTEPRQADFKLYFILKSLNVNSLI